MKDHREPPPSDAEDPRPRWVTPQRLALPSPGPVRPGRLAIDRSRAGFWLAIAVGGLLVSYLTYLGARAARSWLGDQPAYQLPFRAIVLDPPPPSWYREGTSGFLEDVRQRARMPESLPLLKLDPDELKSVFKGSPWVADEPSINYQPLGVTVHLVYYQPVALVETSTSKTTYLVDRSAIILPLQDVNLERLRSESGLITINGENLADPQDSRAGHVWKPRAGLTDLAPGNDQIPAAARLADFLSEKIRSIDIAKNPALDFRYIVPMDPDRRGLFLRNAESVYILWGEAPGEEVPGHLTAEEKWEILKGWKVEGRIEPVPDNEYWKIAPEGVIKVITQHSSPKAARVAASRRDRATIPAKTPGQSGSSASHWK